jgi:hypothetical protein
MGLREFPRLGRPTGEPCGRRLGMEYRGRHFPILFLRTSGQHSMVLAFSGRSDRNSRRNFLCISCWIRILFTEYHEGRLLYDCRNRPGTLPAGGYRSEQSYGISGTRRTLPLLVRGPTGSGRLVVHRGESLSFSARCRFEHGTSVVKLISKSGLGFQGMGGRLKTGIQDLFTGKGILT